MDSASISDWLQVIGLFGVIASLIFVGLQMKQDRAIAISQSYQGRTQIGIETMSSFMNHPGFIPVLLRVRADGLASLEPEEHQLLVIYVRMMLSAFENLHFQRSRGFLDTEHWEKNVNQLKTFLLNADIRPLVLEEIDTGLCRATYAAFLERLAQEMDNEAGGE